MCHIFYFSILRIISIGKYLHLCYKLASNDTASLSILIQRDAVGKDESLCGALLAKLLFTLSLLF